LIRRWPALEATDTCAFAGFSLQVEGRCLGVMSLGYVEDHVFDEGERAFLTAVAEQAAVALRRAQAGEVEEGARARRTFLAEASLKLTNRYAGPDQLLKTLVEIAVPRLADYCTVILRRRGRFEQVAFAHDLGEQSEKTLPLVGDIGEIVETGPALEVFLTGRPAVFGGGGTPLDPADFGPLAASIDMTSAMLVPLESHGRSVGVMSFIACGKHAAYRREDLELARELATRAGALVDDLAQRARDRQLAETLTRALLPARLPNVPGVEIAARYLPAESGPVGGDWYDVFELGDGRLALVVGDVGGHGVEAASTMIRLRNGMLAFVAEGHDAVTTFERLSLLLTAETSEWNLPDPIATLLYSTLDLSSWNLHTACAGHPPWLLLRGGHPEVVECGGRVLAGGLPASIAEQDYQLYPGDVAIFMTDGLIERPGEDLEHSFGRLTSALEGVRETDLGTLCDMALDATMPPLGRRDDCCLLALRLVPGQEEEVVVATSLANRASSMSSSVTPLAS
ncbi:MAG: SpoIIE family protein phosphatase, partial [Acidimicrobiales bacterium]